MSVRIEVSVGELIDKLTILEIKRARISDRKKQENIQRELAALYLEFGSIEIACHAPALLALREDLKSINEKLWDIEDAIREKERQKTFDAAFIQLARNVYITNDDRSHLKRRIDELMGASFTEEKSYQPY